MISSTSLIEGQAWLYVKLLVCVPETDQRLEGLTGSIKRPDLDGGVLAPAE